MFMKKKKAEETHLTLYERSRFWNWTRPYLFWLQNRKYETLTLVLPGGWLPTPSRIQSTSFAVIDGKKSGVPRGGKVSRQRWRVQGGGCHLRKLKVAILKKNVDCMVLKLTVYIRNVIFFSYKPKFGEILIFRTFLAKFSILAYISLKIGYVVLGHDYGVTVTSYLWCWYLFWYVWKKETPSYTMLPITCAEGFI